MEIFSWRLDAILEWEKSSHPCKMKLKQDEFGKPIITNFELIWQFPVYRAASKNLKFHDHHM